MFKQLFSYFRQIFCRRREDRLDRIRERAMVRLKKSILACEGKSSDAFAVQNLCYQEGYFHAVHSLPVVTEKICELGYLPGYEEGMEDIFTTQDYARMRQGYSDALNNNPKQSGELSYLVGYQNGQEVKEFTDRERL